MKIALVQPKFDQSGGAERYAVGLARGLAARGHRVHLFGRKAPERPAGTVFHPVPCLPLGRALKTYSFWRMAQWRVDPRRFQVVQGSGKTTVQTVHRAGGGLHRAFMERQGGGAPDTYDRVVLRIEDEIFGPRGAPTVVVPASWVRREIERYYPAAAGRVRLVPNGVDTGGFAPEGRPGDRNRQLAALGLGEETPLLLFAATNFALKGLEEAVAALPRLPGAHLLVAGGDDPAPFLAQAVALGVSTRLHFLGAQSHIQVLYRAADVLIHPTHWDTFGNVCLEALACGCPVVTTDQAGAAEVLGEGGRVLAFPVDPGALVQAVEALLVAGPGGRERARRVALAHSVEAHVAAMEALYREVAG